MEIINKAFNVAFEKHAGQTRKSSKTPYIVHILDAAKNLMYEDVSDEIVAAGILHDTLEDTDYTQEELKSDFGEVVFRLVEVSTEPGNTPNQTREEAKSTWKTRKQHSINLYQTLEQDELWVPLADKLANLQSIYDDLLCIGDDLWGRFNAPKEEIAWYYISLRDVFSKHFENTRMFKIFNNLVEKVFTA